VDGNTYLNIQNTLPKAKLLDIRSNYMDSGFLNYAHIKLIGLFLFLFNCHSSFGQQLIYSEDFLNNRRISLFVFAKPAVHISLYPEVMKTYTAWFQQKKLDSSILFEIIQNAKEIDTSIWKEEELKSFIIVDNRNDTVSKSYAVKKANKLDSNKVKTLVDYYNLTSPNSRIITSLSRPIFDNSKKYAIIEISTFWDAGLSGVGGEDIFLYHFQDNRWIQVGAIFSLRI
jgi:hypothetical protein